MQKIYKVIYGTHEAHLLEASDEALLKILSAVIGFDRAKMAVLALAKRGRFVSSAVRLWAV